MAAETLAETTDAAGPVAPRHPVVCGCGYLTVTVTVALVDGCTVALPS